MENGWHITDRGNKVTLSDSQGQVFAAGDMNPRVVFSARGLDAPAGHYTQTTELNVPLKIFNNPAATSGRGRIKICIPVDPYAPPEKMVCRNLGNQLGSESSVQENGRKLHRHWQFDHEVDYVVNGREVSVTKWYGIDDYESVGPHIAGFSLNGGGVGAPAVSGAHPASSAGAQQKGTKKDFQSPLVLDLDFDGKLNLVDVWNEKTPIHYDINGDGVKTRSGWVSPTEGLLFIDRNGDGIVTDGRELFSEFSWAYSLSDPVEKRFSDGFSALNQYDKNADTVIDKNDPVFNYLKVWIDRNMNGISEKNEMVSLSSLNIESFDLFFEKSGDPLHESGNEVRLIGSYKTGDGKKHLLADVWFRMRIQ